MPQSNSLAAIMRLLAASLQEGDPRFAYVGTTTSAGNAGGTTLVDSALAYSGEDTDLLERSWVRIDSGTYAGQVRRIVSAGLTVASGTITVDPAFGGQIAGSIDYSIWTIQNPISIRRLLNRLLGNKKRDTIVPVSMITDADMETTGVTNWPALAAPTTREKSTTTRFIRHGSQSLHILASANNSGAESVDVTASLGPLAIPNTPWLAGATLRVPTGTAKIIVRDVTGSANISPATVTSNQNAWQSTFFTWTPPASCQEVRMRFLGSANLDEFYVDDAILWPTMQREFELPSWLEDPADIIGLGYYRLRSSPANAYLYTPEEAAWVPWGWQDAEIDESAAHPYRVHLDTPIRYPLYMKARRPYATLTLDTDTTTADAEGLAQSALWEIYNRLATENIEHKALFERYMGLRQDVGQQSFYRLLKTRELPIRPKIKGPRWGAY